VCIALQHHWLIYPILHVESIHMPQISILVCAVRLTMNGLLMNTIHSHRITSILFTWLPLSPSESEYDTYIETVSNILKQFNLDGRNEHKPEWIHTKSFIHSWTVKEEDGKCSFKQQRPVQSRVSVKSNTLQLLIDTKTAQNRIQHSAQPITQLEKK